ncbi:hypothetical protein I79_007623 [Cricetulus griseus]|uniref:Uncharacterized protein n=1 Tax=Cricetulus griseus TaxID=10029 RepID=G3HB10_CRIGR|nr:hypothetical protein I79_007623 [Cricetulus griseus]
MHHHTRREHLGYCSHLTCTTAFQNNSSCKADTVSTLQMNAFREYPTQNQGTATAYQESASAEMPTTLFSDRNTSCVLYPPHLEPDV